MWESRTSLQSQNVIIKLWNSWESLKPMHESENQENHGFPYNNNTENHENHRISRGNYENIGNLRIPHENTENHENTIIP